MVFNARSKHPNVKALMALVSQCLDKKEVLSKAFDDLNLIKKEPKLDVCLAEILVMELWNKKQLPGHSKPVETIQKVRYIDSTAAYKTYKIDRMYY